MGLYQYHGHRLGYPSCCIEHFESEIQNGKAPFEEMSKSHPGDWMFTGFVPCPKCGEEINKNGFDHFVGSRITPNRNHWLPFPHDSIALRSIPAIIADRGLWKGLTFFLDDLQHHIYLWCSIRISRFSRMRPSSF